MDEDMAKEKISWATAPDYTSKINKRFADRYFEGRPDRIYRPPVMRYNIIQTPEGERVEECKTVVVHEFKMSDVEDPDLWAAESLMEWEKSDAGQWVMKNAADTPTWYRDMDTSMMGWRYQIRAKLMGPALTEWLLRYGK